MGERIPNRLQCPNALHRWQSAIADRFPGRGSVSDGRAPDRELRSGSLLDLRRPSRTEWNLSLRQLERMTRRGLFPRSCLGASS